jgi:hypothetical protein
MSFLRLIYDYKLLITSVLSVHHNVYRTFLTNMYKTQLIPKKGYYLQMKNLRFWLWNFKSVTNTKETLKCAVRYYYKLIA